MLRLRKRVKIFGGFGLNLGKRGVGWSLRTKGGSVSNRGASVRTGIPGVTIQAPTRSRGKRASDQTEESSTAGALVWLAIIIGVVYWLF
jgi:hypothetical protein